MTDGFNFSQKAKAELVAYLEEFFGSARRRSAATGSANAVLFNDPNTTLTSRYLTVTANADIPADDASIVLTAAGTVGDFDITAKGILLLRSTSDSVQIEADGGNLVLFSSADMNLVPAGNAQASVKPTKQFVVLNDQTTFTITALNQGAKTFTIAGDHVALYVAGNSAIVSGAGSNDGIYTVVVASLSAGNTVIQVVQAIASSIVAGVISPSLSTLFQVTGNGVVESYVPVKVAGASGATAATRYAGATASGSPAIGTFQLGDFIVAQDGKVWVCTVAGSPGTWVDVGGGGAVVPVDLYQQLNGNAVTIANAATDSLTWDTSFGPDSLLDISTPNTPTIITTGVYTINVSVSPTTDMTVGGQWHLEFISGLVVIDSPPATAAVPRPSLAASFTQHLSATTPVLVNVTNLDGVGSVDFAIYTSAIQRFS